jgi:hypothetical protein
MYLKNVIRTREWVGQENTTIRKTADAISEGTRKRNVDKSKRARTESLVLTIWWCGMVVADVDVCVIAVVVMCVICVRFAVVVLCNC